MTEPKRRERRKTLTDKMVAALPRQRKRYIVADPEQRGHYVRVPVQGPCVFAAVARYRGRQVWATLGSTADMQIDEARDKAREAIKRIKKGLPAFEPPPVQPDSFAAVAENWLKRHVEAKGLRTGGEFKRVLEKYVLPHWRDRVFVDIKRSDIALLLDLVEDKHGHWMADSVLSTLRALSTWHAARDDNYTPPFVKNMRRTPPQARKRTRILNDDELQKVWRAADAAGTFGAFIQVLLLTAQRREKVATMRWDDVSEDGVWTIPTAPREKGNPGTLRLPPLAMRIIAAQPRRAGNPFVFPGHSDGPVGGFSARHPVFKALCGVEDNWSLHDGRRTARSLMARAGVPTEIGERVLGHARGTIEGTYNVYGYTSEMGDALARLARLIEQIVDGDPGKNVVPWRAGAVQA